MRYFGIMPERMKYPILFENIKELRRRLGESQEKFADRLGASQGSVSRWGDQSIPRGDTLANLADLAGVTPKQFIDEPLPARALGMGKPMLQARASVGALTQMIAEIVEDELPGLALPANFARILATGLHEQLGLTQSSPSDRGSTDEMSALDTAAQSRAPKKASASAGSRRT